MIEQPPKTSIGELMQRDPLSLSTADLDAIIAELRKQRHLFTAENNKTIGKPEAKKSAPQKAKENLSADIKASDINIDDLFGDL